MVVNSRNKNKKTKYMEGGGGRLKWAHLNPV